MRHASWESGWPENRFPILELGGSPVLMPILWARYWILPPGFFFPPRLSSIAGTEEEWSGRPRSRAGAMRASALAESNLRFSSIRHGPFPACRPISRSHNFAVGSWGIAGTYIVGHPLAQVTIAVEVTSAFLPQARDSSPRLPRRTAHWPGRSWQEGWDPAIRAEVGQETI